MQTNTMSQLWNLVNILPHIENRPCGSGYVSGAVMRTSSWIIRAKSIIVTKPLQEGQMRRRGEECEDVILLAFVA